MTEREFSNWFAFHSARFPNWASWLSKMPSEQSREVTRAMYEVLADRNLDDCKHASRMLASGDEPEIDQFDMHPRAVRAVAKRLSGQRIKTSSDKLHANMRERTYRCTRCWDAAVPLVTVFQNCTLEECRDVELARQIVERKRPVYTTAVACDCARGQEHARVARVKVYNDRMLLVSNKLGWNDRLKALVEFANRSTRNEWSPGE